MGWTLSNARLRRELLAPDPAAQEALGASAVVYRDTPHCLSTPNYSIDLSALIRRLGAAIGEPSATLIVAAIMSSLPPLDLGTDDEPMHVLLGLDWVAAHTPLRVDVNRARARPALVAANRLTATDIGPETRVDFAAIMATPALKRHFFGVCADTLRDRLCRLPVKNVVFTFLSCDGKVHTATFGPGGEFRYDQTQRRSGYGEADIEIPLYMRKLAPHAQWEYQTIDWDSAFVIALMGMSTVTVRLSKTDDPTAAPDSRKRKRAVHEVIHGDRLCSAWPNVATAFCRIAQGDTDYSKAGPPLPISNANARARLIRKQGLKPYGIKGLLAKEAEMGMALYVNENDELVLDLKAFVAVIASAATHKARRVHIGPDKVIHLTSRPGTQICERPLEMLHSNLVRLLWTVAYYRGAGFDADRSWKGPDPTLYGLRLWGRGVLQEEAFSGTTTPAELHPLGNVPPLYAPVPRPAEPAAALE